jgi:spore maturation protein CgeB
MRDRMKILLIHPGAHHSTADVEAGLRYGLEYAGVEIVQFRLDNRIPASQRFLHTQWRRARKTNPAIEKPTWADVVYQAGMPVIERALRNQVDVVLVVSAMLLHPDIIILLKRAGFLVAAVFTESPYDLTQELAIAKLVDCCWTNERSCLGAFQAVNPHAGYLPAAWHLLRHTPTAGSEMPDVPSHDVVFVGSGFPSRIDWLSKVDWTGIDFGLYGTWQDVPSRHALRPFIHQGAIENTAAIALYRHARITLNLYRGGVVLSSTKTLSAPGESLNPRAYELAASGIFHLSEWRAEVPDVFGNLVPMFKTPQDASALIRLWLQRDQDRVAMASALPAVVAESSWVARASRVIGDVQQLVRQHRAA